MTVGMRIKRLFVEFHVVLFPVFEIRSWVTLQSRRFACKAGESGLGPRWNFFRALSSQDGPARRKVRKQSGQHRRQHGRWTHVPSTRQTTTEFHLILPRKEKYMQHSGVPSPLPDSRAPVIYRNFLLLPLFPISLALIAFGPRTTFCHRSSAACRAITAPELSVW